MRARGVPWAMLAAAALASACGDDEAGGKPDAEAGSSGNEAGKGGTGGSHGDAGAGNATDAGEPGSAGMGNEMPEGPQKITFTVVGESRGPISPLIYGANIEGLDCTDARARFTFCRNRSTAFSAYNWETNASNAGTTGCNENNDALSASAVPGAAISALIDAADASDATAIVTLPMLDYVAADTDGGDADCSGDVSKTADYLSTRFKQNRARKGEALSLVPDTADDYVNGDELVSFLDATYPSSALIFGLDTQMELWHQEHPTLHPERLSYDQEIALSAEYSQMIKDTRPDSKVLGLSGYGYLAALSQQMSPDFEADGEFWSYYLAGMKAASDEDGRRLLDYVGLHWFAELYPENQRIIEEAVGPESVAARVQAPRSLWDPTYVEDSWITQTFGKPVELLPWLLSAIDENYPGTQLAITEWSYGGGEHISGAVAAADALGVFGREGVELAGVVSFSPGDEPYLLGAFQAYRNYDGEGHGFGDTSIAAESSKIALGSVYASVDNANPSRMVIVAINRYSDELEAKLEIEHDVSYSSVTPYQLFDGQPELLAGGPIEASADSQFEFTMPPYSVWVLVPSE